MALEADKDITCFFSDVIHVCCTVSDFFPLIVSELISHVKVGEDQPKQSLRLQPLRAMRVERRGRFPAWLMVQVGRARYCPA